jgi:hypothetical protein
MESRIFGLPRNPEEEKVAQGAERRLDKLSAQPREGRDQLRRAAVVAAIAASISLTAGAGSAEAHKRKIERRTTVQFEELPGSTGDRVYGQVSLGSQPQEPFYAAGGPPTARAAGIAGKCLAGKKVLIKHTLTAEGGGSDPPTLVGTATTDAQGAWQFTSYEAAGANQLLFDTFQIEVVKTRLAPKNFRHKHVCKGAFGNKTVFSP